MHIPRQELWTFTHRFRERAPPMNEMLHNLLAIDEPAPATVHNENGASHS
jgi:hypothetical protein